jgi:hypothetical protein
MDADDVPKRRDLAKQREGYAPQRASLPAPSRLILNAEEWTRSIFGVDWHSLLIGLDDLVLGGTGSAGGRTQMLSRTSGWCPFVLNLSFFSPSSSCGGKSRGVNRWSVVRELRRGVNQ